MEIRLEHPEFRASVADLHDACEAITTARARASGHVGLLLTDGWSGRAAAAFSDAWDDWLTASDGVVRSLSSIAADLAALHSSLTIADTSSSDALARVAGRLS